MQFLTLWLVLAAVWGVSTTFSMVKSSLDRGSGSCSNTSSLTPCLATTFSRGLASIMARSTLSVRE
ncbi:MAG: hypothetical protein PUE19_00705 [bacterium]|nr:hypothetical protein [bacterium]MDD5856718.1 hypothetical protein [bacterium]